MAYLLDTNVCIAAMRGNANVLGRLLGSPPDSCLVSSITVYELYGGVERAVHPQKERVKVEALIANVVVMSLDEHAAKEAAKIRYALEKIGMVIGPYDLLIAGHALALGLTLVTHNTDEFKRVAGLALEDWQI